MNNSDGNNVRLTVKWRNGFSDRSDIFPINTEIQKESLDERVRTRLYNIFMEYFKSVHSPQSVANLFLQEFYLTSYTYDGRYNEGYGSYIFREAVNDTISNDHWANVLTFIEFWFQLTSVSYEYEYQSYNQTLKGIINNIFESEFVGYRLIDSRITPIISDIEILAIEESLQNPSSEVKTHIKKSLEKLSNREKPDYENSIKESISSVEAMANIITGGHNATLGKALEQLEKNGVYIHPSLKQSFKTLFGYTSDSTGIRHAGAIGGKGSTFEEAQFMLITCSAFNNYLLANKK